MSGIVPHPVPNFVYETVVIPDDYVAFGRLPTITEEEVAAEPPCKKPRRAGLTQIGEKEAIAAFRAGTMVGLRPTDQPLATIGQRRWTSLTKATRKTVERNDHRKAPSVPEVDKVAWYLQMCQKETPKRHKRGAKKKDHLADNPITNYGILVKFCRDHPEEKALVMLRVMCVMAPLLSGAFVDRAAAYEANKKLNDDMKAREVERCTALEHAFDDMADDCAAIEAGTTWKKVKEALESGFPELSTFV